MQVLKTIENPLAVMLQSEALQLGGLMLQSADRPAVIKAEGQIIASTCRGEIQGQLQVEFKPLSPFPLKGQDPDMGPQPQLTHNDPIVRHADDFRAWVRLGAW